MTTVESILKYSVSLVGQYHVRHTFFGYRRNWGRSAQSEYSLGLLVCETKKRTVRYASRMEIETRTQLTCVFSETEYGCKV